MNESLGVTASGSSDERAPVVLLHGLTFDRRQWGPVRAALSTVDPDRRVVAFDLPGHGESPRRDTYRAADVAAVVHSAVRERALTAPVLVGHSLGGVLASVYAAAYPTSAVVNIDQPLLPGAFLDVLRRAEPELRGPGYLRVWERLRAGMGLDALPPDARALVGTATTPRQELFLGYWSELFDTDAAELTRQRAAELAAVRANGVPYHHVSGGPLAGSYRDWLLAQVPEARLTELPGSGHFPHLARPDEVARIIATLP
ncbi:alpha/beta hydrolase [Virgisporangium aliadipatigenens]|uniref:Alpha/beta hydrolase n=1 Tax=Virgisporangium aliadipatigenens TaxID=741659 RepID=A0A8J3YRI0_9ACTN|nr:alpha/beta hydrolase [Virgisporangium aliadipatigenens]GIJ49162.1 alpha/beta hydrolase [Virgisporangium aliadipatigenens]